MKPIQLTAVLLFSAHYTQTLALDTIEVASGTVKVQGMLEETMHYGFAEGDVIVFNCEVLDHKDLKEFEIKEYEGTSKFMEYRVRKIVRKTVKVNRTGIFVFRFANSALTGRIVRFGIQRIPRDNSTVLFNTSVVWKEVFDTTYTPSQDKYLIKTDTVIVPVVDQKAKISSQTAINGNTNKTIVDFNLPPNTKLWSYYIGVGNEGKAAYDAAQDKFVNSAANVALTIPGYGAMAALALHGISYFSKTQGEDNVQYWFITDWNNAQAFYLGNQFLQYKLGNVVNDASQMRAPLAGKVYIGLLNDNVMDAIDVYVKVTAITITEEWGVREAKKMEVKSEKRAFLNQDHE